MMIYLYSATENERYYTDYFSKTVLANQVLVITDFADFSAQVASYRPPVVILDCSAPGVSRLSIETLKGFDVQYVVAGLWPHLDLKPDLPFDLRIDPFADASDDIVSQLEYLRGGVTEPKAQPDHIAGELAVFWGPQGAPGRSTLMLATAAVMSRECSVVVIDGDTMAPAIAQLVGINADQPGIVWAVRESNRGTLDPSTLAQQVVHCAEGYDILTGLNRADRWIELDEPNLQRLWDVSMQSYERVFVDIGFFLEPPPAWQGQSQSYRSVAAITALRAADTLVTLTRVDPVSIARCLNQLDDLRDQGMLPPRHHIIFNQVIPSQQRHVREAKRLLSTYATDSEMTVLAQDSANFNRAVLRGQSVPVFNEKAEVHAKLSALVKQW